MDENSMATKAIQSASESVMAYCKFLSANDSGETGSHQAGILISKKAIAMLFEKDTIRVRDTKRRTVTIRWQDDFETESNFIYYGSKLELRITGFGRDFPYLNAEDTGALFVLTEQDREHYAAFILQTEDDIGSFLDAFGISPTETNNVIEKRLTASAAEFYEIQRYIDSISIVGQGGRFPDSYTMSATAREIENKVYDHLEYTITRPDEKLIAWTEQEYRLFRVIEESAYAGVLWEGFRKIDRFLEFANQVINRRKSRAGKSLEHHISALFDANGIAYEAQVRTEGNKKPDFIFPSGAAYHDGAFPVEKLVSLASKTTCKDRWRQVINEADRLRDKDKFLLTLQQGVSSAQLEEMAKERVILVVPKPYIVSYPEKQRDKLWTIKKFIEYLKELGDCKGDGL